LKAFTAAFEAALTDFESVCLPLTM